MTPLTKALNRSPYIFYFLVADEFLDIDPGPDLSFFHLIYLHPPQTKPHSPFFALNNTSIPQNSGRLLSHPQVRQYIADTSQKAGKIPAIIPFKPSAKIDLICRSQNWLKVANDAAINRRLEDKLKFAKLIQKNNLPHPPFVITPLTSQIFTQLQQKFGQNLVIQTHFGWAGKSTFAASQWSQIEPLIASGTKVKISPLLSGYTLLNNCCLCSNTLFNSPPALQFTGLSPLTNNPFTTVGRQWPSTASTTVEDQVNRITTQMGSILAASKYRGYFGLDFLVSPQGEALLLECNPRLTASFGFYHQLEYSLHRPQPLFFLHLAAFALPKFSPQPSSPSKVAGAQLVKKNVSGQTTARAETATPITSSPLNPPSPPTINSLFPHE